MLECVVAGVTCWKDVVADTAGGEGEGARGAGTITLGVGGIAVGVVAAPIAAAAAYRNGGNVGARAGAGPPLFNAAATDCCAKLAAGTGGFATGGTAAIKRHQLENLDRILPLHTFCGFRRRFCSGCGNA